VPVTLPNALLVSTKENIDPPKREKLSKRAGLELWFLFFWRLRNLVNPATPKKKLKRLAFLAPASRKKRYSQISCNVPPVAAGPAAKLSFLKQFWPALR
jgi:hypothetical protein